MLLNKFTTAFIFALLILGCNQPQKEKVIVKSNIVKPIKPITIYSATPSSTTPANIDLLVNYYVANAKNELVASSRNDSTIKEEAIFDDYRKIGAITYKVFNVGHDVIDGDGARFVNDSWIFIDSATNRIYESTSDGALVKWGNK